METSEVRELLAMVDIVRRLIRSGHVYDPDEVKKYKAALKIYDRYNKVSGG